MTLINFLCLYILKLLTPYKPFSYLEEYFHAIEQINSNVLSNKTVILNMFIFVTKVIQFVLIDYFKNYNEIALKMLLFDYFYIFNISYNLLYVFAALQACGAYYAYVIFFKVYDSDFSKTPREFLGLSHGKMINNDFEIRNSPKLSVKTIKKLAMLVLNFSQIGILASSMGIYIKNKCLIFSLISSNFHDLL